MAIELALPMTRKSFYSATESAANLRVMNAYRVANAALLASVERFTNVPTEVTLSYMFVESECGRLDTSPKSPLGAVGDMQIDAVTATAALNREIAKGRMSAEEATFCRKYIGANYDRIVRTKPQTGGITQKQLLQRPFNVYIATVFLGQLLDANTEGGVLRMDKVLVLYNRGINSHPQGGSADAIINWAQKKWPGKKGRITADYVAKLVGANGLLTTLASS